MISPIVRRLRLASELVTLRKRHDYSAERLAQELGVGRSSISRWENGHAAPDLDVIMKISALFGVGEERWQRLMTIGREAQERGWWSKYADQMGARQALYANLEAGATSISEYQMTMLPGLLQTPPYTAERMRLDPHGHPAGFDPVRALEARAARQRLVERPDGPRYHVIIDELAVRRAAAPAEILTAQIDHLIEVGQNRRNTTIQVLPVTAAIVGDTPRSAFYCYQYPDPDDPMVVVVDTITSDLLLTDAADPVETKRYVELYESLRHAALSPADSLDFLAALTESPEPIKDSVAIDQEKQPRVDR